MVNAHLQRCLRARCDPAVLPTVHAQVADPAFDWSLWQQEANAQFLAPLLYHTLRGRQLLPPAVEQSLHQVYTHTARRNLFLFHELGIVLRLLAGAGIDVILLKGAALSEMVYGNIALRPLRDLDLLLRGEDVPIARALLEQRGYMAPEPEALDDATLRYENELLLYKPGPINVPIELHWSLFDSPYYQHTLSMDWFWETAVPARLNNTPALMLGPEAQLLHLCAHLALHHRGDELLWLHDIAEVYRLYRGQINWNELFHQARMGDLVLPLQQILPDVSGRWGLPLPEQPLLILQSLVPSAGERQVFTWLTTPGRPVRQRFWADLATLPSWHQRLHYGLGNLFPSVAYMQHRYNIRHPWLTPFYYPYRWFVGLAESD